MSRNTQVPEIERTPDDPIHGSVERHPAYGLIEAHRWTGGSAFLYGSDFRHESGVSIAIKRSELCRGLSRDYAAERDVLIEVHLSEAQWATFVSTLNSGIGTQCTLRWLPDEDLPGIERVTERKKQFAEEMGEHLGRLKEIAARLKAMEESGKFSKREIRDVRISLENFEPNVGFVAEQFREHVEEVTEHAKIEVSAYVAGAIQKAGLAALKGGGPISIEDSKGREKS